jgi:DNA-binding MarR family transcriptional regulator
MEVASSKKSRSTEPSVGVLLKRAEQAMVKAKNAVLRPVGLSLAQYVALLELERQSGITAAMLARASFVSPQAIMILLKSMEQQGLIARLAHPRHANVLELHMTDVGREALHTARAEIDPVERRVSNAFSAKEMASLRALLSRFVEAIDPE